MDSGNIQMDGLYPFSKVSLTEGEISNHSKRQLPETPQVSQVFLDSTQYAKNFVHNVKSAISDPLNELQQLSSERVSFKTSNGHFMCSNHSVRACQLNFASYDPGNNEHSAKNISVSNSSYLCNAKSFMDESLDKLSNVSCIDSDIISETGKHKCMEGKRRCKSETENAPPTELSLTPKRPRGLSSNVNKYQNVIDAFDSTIPSKMVTSIIKKLAAEEPKVYDLSRCAKTLKAYSLKPCSVVLQDFESLLQSSRSNSEDVNCATPSTVSSSSQAPTMQVVCRETMSEPVTSQITSLDTSEIQNELEDGEGDSDAEIESDAPNYESSESCTSELSGEENQDPILSSLSGEISATAGENCLIAVMSNHIQRVSSVEECHLPLPIGPSMFSYVPPFVNFTTQDVKVREFPELIRKQLKWRLSTITPILVRRTVTNIGFKLNRKSEAWVGTWGKHMLSACFKTIKETQKVNHIPGSFQIGRKDRLWKNFLSLQARFGKKLFNYIPQTYVLPGDLKILKQDWDQCDHRVKWIVKPPASARGQGIKVISKWHQIPKKKGMIVQKYISKPYLINGTKFDLRIYVIVTSVHPLRIYIYDDGLARFASVRYSSSARSLNDRFIHLTNYSINKNSLSYFHNDDVDACQGHKWTLKALWRYLDEQGVNTQLLWRKIKDIVVKTIISAEPQLLSISSDHVTSNYTCYELFGFDVMLDERLKPWLLEVNISPSLHSATPLDMAVKGQLIRDVLNLAMFHLPAGKAVRLREKEFLEQYGLQSCIQNMFHDKRLYSKMLGEEEKRKHEIFMSGSGNRGEYLHEILRDLTPDDIRILCRHEDEIERKGNFVRVFPTSYTHRYHKYFDGPRYYNYLVDAWENRYRTKRPEGRELLESFCSRKVHLKVYSARLMSQTLLTNDQPIDKSATEVVFGGTHQGNPIDKITKREFPDDKTSCHAAGLHKSGGFSSKQDEGMLEVVVGPSGHHYV